MDITATQNVSKPRHLMQSRPCAAPTAEQHTHMKMHAFIVKVLHFIAVNNFIIYTFQNIYSAFVLRLG